MNINMFIKLSLVIFFISLTPLFSQPISRNVPSSNYSLAGLINSAKENNITLKQASLNYEMARLRLSMDRTDYLPEVAVGVSRTESYTNIYFEGHQSSDRAYFDVSKTISLNDATYFRNQNSKHDLLTSQLAFQMEIQSLLFNIISNYIDVLTNQKRSNLREEYITIQENIVNEVRILFRQNTRTLFDVQQAEINLLNAKIEALQAKNNLNDSRRRLFDLINITDEGNELEEVSLYTSESADTFHREIVLDQILEVQKHQVEVQKTKTNITQTRLGLTPDLRLSYHYNRSLTSDDFSYHHGSTDHTIALGLSYSFSNLFKTPQTIRQTKFLEEQSKLKTSQLMNNIRLNFEKYFEELDYLAQRDVLLASRLQQTTENLEMGQQRFRLGLITQLELDNITNDNLEAQITKESNYYELILKKLNIDYLLSNELWNQ